MAERETAERIGLHAFVGTECECERCGEVPPHYLHIDRDDSDGEPALGEETGR